MKYLSLLAAASLMLLIPTATSRAANAPPVAAPTPDTIPGTTSGTTSGTTLAPGTVLHLAVPEWPAGVSVSLPANYKAEGKYPLFVYLSTVEKPLDSARSAIGPNDYICVGVPVLPAGQSTGKTAAPSFLPYQTLLNKLHETIPNSAAAGNVLGGFGPGADQIGQWLAARNASVLDSFQTFFALEGGIEPLRSRGLPDSPSPKRRFLLLRGDGKQEPSAEPIERRAKAAKVALTSVVLQTYNGKTEESQHLYLVGQWVRGSRLPERIIAPSREELKARFAARQFTDSLGHTLNYRLFVPKNYDPKRAYPLTIFLHGSGESGTNNETQLLNFGPGVLSDPQTQAKYPSFVLAPQCPRSAQWGFNYGEDWPQKTVIELMGALQKEFSLDATRFYITGISLGGMGTWNAITQHPDLFAAAIPVAGAGDASVAATLRPIPLWALHGTNDRAVPIAGKWRGTPYVGDRDMIEALQKVGGTPKFTVFEGEGHGIWCLAYNQPGLIDWLFHQRRKP